MMSPRGPGPARPVRTPRFFHFGPFTVGPESHLLLRDGVPVRLGSRALDILTALVERPGEVVSARDLFARVWPKTVVEAENLRVNMAALRRALADDASAARYIATVVGRGYQFIAPVRVCASPDASLVPALEAGGRDFPAGVTDIFGRAEAFDAIRLGLREARLVSIVGAGGIGKTTVAVAAARAIGRDCADGMAFIDLAAIGDARLIPALIASSLGLSTTCEEPLAGVVHALRSQQKLLLFDNCEHVLPAVAAAMERLAAGVAGVRMLATSREPLRIRGERVHRLAGLACDPSEHPSADEARRYPAVALFAARAAARAGYRLTDADAPAVAEVCRRLDGNALAIELAATQAARFAPSRIRDMLDHSFQLLKLGPREGPLRHQTLMATLDWSYGLLSERDAAMLRALSVFARAFGVDGALAVSGMETADALDSLAQLAAKSLLTTHTRMGTIGYRLLETTRAYALERLRNSHEEPAVRRRHARHVSTLLERAAAEWARRSPREWGAAYGSILDDLHAALAFAGGDPAERRLLLRLTVAGTRLWNHLSLSNECLGHVTRAVEELEAAGLAGTATEMTLQLSLAGTMMFTKGFVPGALGAMHRALEIAGRIGDTDHQLRALRLIFSFEKFVGRHDAAIRTIERCCAMAAAADPTALPDGETHLGMAEFYLGRLPASRKRLERLARHHLRDVDDPRFARFFYDRNVDVMNVLSNVQWLTGSPGTALRTVEGAVAQALQVRHGLSLVNALATAACPVLFLAGHHRQLGHYLDMLDHELLRHGIVIWRPIARFYRAAQACAGSEGCASGVMGLERALAEFRDIHHWARMPFYLSVLAEALVRCDRIAEAEAAIGEALDRARTQSEGWCVPELLRVRASVLAADARVAEAEAVLAEAMSAAREIGALSWGLRAANDLAMLWCAQSRVEDAQAMLRPIVDRFTEGQETRDLDVASGLLLTVAPARKRA